jgi:hypothetical protein
MMTSTLQGGCLCGHIRYEVTGRYSSSSTCFCRSCRRASGAASVAWFVVSLGQFRWLAAEPRAHRSSAPVTRSFCGQCGTPLAYQHTDRPDDIELTTATLDDPEAIPPEEEIWLDHKVGWAMSDGRLPHFSEDH